MELFPHISANSEIFVLTGAGISKESGLNTFRDNDGLWNNHRVKDVATPEAFTRNPTLVYDFYNNRRRELNNGTKPNKAHFNLVELDDEGNAHLSKSTDIIVERRDLDRSEVLSLADGRVYTGRQALENGLIDEIGNELKARIWLEENKNISLKLPITTLKPVKDSLRISELISRITRKSLTTNALLLDGLLSVWHPDI